MADRPVHLEDQDHVGGVLHEGAEALLARPEGLLLTHQSSVAAPEPHHPEAEQAHGGAAQPREDGHAHGQRPVTPLEGARPHAGGEPERLAHLFQPRAPRRHRTRLVETPRGEERERLVDGRLLSLHGGADPSRRATAALQAQESVECEDAPFRILQTTEIGGELLADLAQPAGELAATARIQDRLALEDVLLTDALFDLRHQKEGPPMGCRLLDEEKSPEGREAREQQPRAEREPARNAGLRPCRRRVGTPGLARYLGCPRPRRGPRPERAERPAGKSSSHEPSQIRVTSPRSPGAARNKASLVPGLGTGKMGVEGPPEPLVGRAPQAELERWGPSSRSD